MNKALAGLDTFERFYVHLSLLELNEKVRKNTGICSCESSTFHGPHINFQ